MCWYKGLCTGFCLQLIAWLGTYFLWVRCINDIANYQSEPLNGLVKLIQNDEYVVKVFNDETQVRPIGHWFDSEQTLATVLNYAGRGIDFGPAENSFWTVKLNMMERQMCNTFPMFQIYGQKYLQIFRHEQDVTGYLTYAVILIWINNWQFSFTFGDILTGLAWDLLTLLSWDLFALLNWK